MGALEKYLDRLPSRFDASKILDADVEKIESMVYDQPTIYKYLSSDRRGFFRLPQLRFTQRDALNDPFEMTQRWNEAKTDGLRDWIKSDLEQILPSMFADTELLGQILEEELLQKGFPFWQIEIARRNLLTTGGQSFVKRQKENAQQLMGPAIDYLFSFIDSKFQEIIRPVTDGMGVLSLTERCLNIQMWAHYATQGAGFVIGLNPQHPIFLSKDGVGKGLLHKVIYTDQRTPKFWRNPYFLFLVKSEGWAYESEWRMLKKLSDCDQSNADSGRQICLINVPVEAITEVYFGYKYKSADVEADARELLSAGARPSFYVVKVNSTSGHLEAQRLDF